LSRNFGRRSLTRRQEPGKRAPTETASKSQCGKEGSLSETAETAKGQRPQTQVRWEVDGGGEKRL